MGMLTVFGENAKQFSHPENGLAVFHQVEYTLKI